MLDNGTQFYIHTNTFQVIVDNHSLSFLLVPLEMPKIDAVCKKSYGFSSVQVRYIILIIYVKVFSF